MSSVNIQVYAKFLTLHIKTFFSKICLSAWNTVLYSNIHENDSSIFSN